MMHACMQVFDWLQLVSICIMHGGYCIRTAIFRYCFSGREVITESPIKEYAHMAVFAYLNALPCAWKILEDYEYSGILLYIVCLLLENILARMCVAYTRCCARYTLLFIASPVQLHVLSVDAIYRFTVFS